MQPRTSTESRYFEGAYAYIQLSSFLCIVLTVIELFLRSKILVLLVEHNH